jgi:hypothetical protein
MQRGAKKEIQLSDTMIDPKVADLIDPQDYAYYDVSWVFRL